MSQSLKKVGLVSLGCAKNRVDSESLPGALRARGMEIVADPAEADAIFVNTCGFIESAKEESIDAILKSRSTKKTGRLKRLFVTGCLSQRYPDALLDEIPEARRHHGRGRLRPARRNARRRGTRPSPLLHRQRRAVSEDAAR